MEKVIACELPELAEGQTRQKIQVFPAAGDYVHPKSGPFTLTADTLAEYADDINARGAQISVDRDHSFIKGQGSKAAGWFVPETARVEDGGVFAEVEWTPTAATEIRNREYRFISPEFSFGHKDLHGHSIPEPKLHAASLTNRPFFTVMEPIAAEDLALEDELLVAAMFGDEMADTLTLISADAAAQVISAAAEKQSASKEPYGRVAYADPGYRKDGKKRYPIDTEEHVRAAWSYINQKRNSALYAPEQVARIKARIKRAAKKFGVTIGADSTQEESMDLTALAEAAGLAADASEDEVFEAFKKIAADNAEMKSKLEHVPSDDQMKTLIASAAKGEKAASQLAEMQKETALKDAIAAGKITPAERDHYAAFWDIDAEGTARLLEAKDPVVPLRAIGSESSVVPVMGADGKPLAAQASDGSTLVADTSPVNVDGVPTPVQEDTAKVHAAALDLLRKRGKTDPTEEEYVAACIEASALVGVEL